MSQSEAIARALAYFDDHDGYFADLARRVAVPTESQNPDRIPDCYRYLEDEMRPAFEAMGYECRIYDNPFENCGPVLLATRIEDPALPTLLGYGHGDVVLGQEGHWKDGRDPWTLERDADRVYGRGTADNKAQHSTHMAALRFVLETRGHLGFNSKFMIETGEENGSRGLKELVAAHRGDFAANMFFASDGPRVDMSKPNLTLGCRGVINFDLALDLREGGHHSGNWGGLLANPGIILAHVLASIVDGKGRILVKGLQPGPISNSVRDALKDVNSESGPSSPQIDDDWGEPGLTRAEKVYAWNTFEVLAFKTGNPKNPVNAIPPKARAACQLRFVVGTDSSDILGVVQKHLDDNGFGMVKVEPALDSNDISFDAARTALDHPWAMWMRAAVERMTKERCIVLPNASGSICDNVFQDVLGLPFVWMPLSYAGCSQHAPDEHILWSLIREGLELVTGIYWDLGDPDKTPPRLGQ